MIEAGKLVLAIKAGRLELWFTPKLVGLSQRGDPPALVTETGRAGCPRQGVCGVEDFLPR